MIPGDFERKLRQCNSCLKIIPPPDLHTRPAGLYFTAPKELIQICGVDTVIIPEREFVDSVGRIIKRGWRKVVQILIDKGYVKKSIAERVYQTRFGLETLRPPTVIQLKDEIDIAKEVTIQSAQNSDLYGNPNDNIVLKRDQLADFTKAIQKEDKEHGS